jgi:hypothetical protein
MTHDYKRHGTTTLFAALDVLEGKVIGQCMKRHRHKEFIRFVNVLDARVSKRLTVHIIVDNYAAHKHPKILQWLARHPRFVFHFTPTSASWLNAVEGLFVQAAPQAGRLPLPPGTQERNPQLHRRYQRQPKTPSSGQRTPIRSSPPSDEGIKC